jgi:cephalosporin hydroxylase
MRDLVVREFHRLFAERGLHANYGRGLHSETRYHGHEAHQCPLDLWIFQEIVHDVRPGLIVELGTYLGGTTLFLAHHLDVIGSGHIVSIDRELLKRPAHPRITYWKGETSSPQILAAVRDRAIAAGGPVLAIHDACHERDQVLRDLENYAPLIAPGSYLIVVDTHVNGHPILDGWGPGPWEAVETFLGRHPEFEQDREREKFLLTYCPGGFLRRKK